MRPDFQSIFAQIDHPALSEMDALLSSAVVQHACVRTVGVTETAIRLSIQRYAERRGAAEVSRYVGRQLVGFYNPKFSKIEELLGHFSASWQARFHEFASSEIRDALDSLVANKNLIAHAKPSGISAGTLRPWVKRAEATCDFLDQLLG